MSLTRAVARPLLSSVFVVGGLDAIRHPEGKVKAAEPVARPIAERVPGLPEDTETLVRINGAVMVGAGTLFALGKFRRLSALALIGTIVPTTYAGHRFWEETDDASRAQQRIHFLKNLGLLGGLIIAALDTEGRPSLGWRARRRAAPAGAMVAGGHKRAGRRGRSAGHDAIVSVEDLLALVPSATGAGAKGAKKAMDAAHGGGARALSEAERAATRARAAARQASASPTAKEVRKAAKKAARTAFEEASKAAGEAGKSAKEARQVAATAAVAAAQRAAQTAHKAGAAANIEHSRTALLHAQKVAAERAHEVPRMVSHTARRGRAAAQPVLVEGVHRAGEMWSQVAEPALSEGMQRAGEVWSQVEPALAGGVHRAGEALTHVAERRPGA